MASVIKVLGQSAPSATTWTTLYTVPALNTAVSSSLTVSNRGAVDSVFSVAVRPLGAALANQHYIYYEIAAPANSTFIATIGLTLAATDVVAVYDVLGTLSFSLFGEETS